MSQLVMNVESCQNTQAKMLQEKEAMLGELTSLTSQINQMVGADWISPAATEFQQTFEQLRSQISQQLDALETLATALQNEINQTVEATNRMG